VNYITQKIKDYFTKENATKVLEVGVDGATEVAHGFLNGILMKIVFTVFVIILLIGGGCVGTNMAIDAVTTKG